MIINLAFLIHRLCSSQYRPGTWSLCEDAACKGYQSWVATSTTCSFEGSSEYVGQHKTRNSSELDPFVFQRYHCDQLNCFGILEKDNCSYPNPKQQFAWVTPGGQQLPPVWVKIQCRNLVQAGGSEGCVLNQKKWTFLILSLLQQLVYLDIYILMVNWWSIYYIEISVLIWGRS